MRTRKGGTQKKNLVGPCQRSGLAAGVKPQAKDGGEPKFFFVAGTRHLSSHFLFFLLNIFLFFIIITIHNRKSFLE